MKSKAVATGAATPTVTTTTLITSCHLAFTDHTKNTTSSRPLYRGTVDMGHEVATKREWINRLESFSKA